MKQPDRTTRSRLTTIADHLVEMNRDVARVVVRAWSLNVDWSLGVMIAAARGFRESLSHDKEKPDSAAKRGIADPVMSNGSQMYNLQKAKEEIDAVARHAMDLATHVLAKSHDVDTKLESFKTEILHAIDTKFADLERLILGGDPQNIETSAVADLGAKVSLLIHGPAEPQTSGESGHDHNQDHHNQDHHDHDQGNHDQGHSNDGWHQNDHHN